MRGIGLLATGGLLAAVLVPVQASASEPVSAPTASTGRVSSCVAGATMQNLGLVWQCRKTGADVVWVATRTSTLGDPSRRGDIGSCVTGDAITVGSLRLVCRRVGGRSAWTRTQGGGASPAASSAIQGRPGHLPGSCHIGSTIQLEGVAVQCQTSGGRRQWSVPGSSGGPTTAHVPLQPGMSRDACVNAWWDEEFAKHIAQFTPRQDPTLSQSIWYSCHVNYARYMTAADKDRIYEGFFAQLGQLVADEVQRYSASTGKNPCQSVKDVMKPVIDDAWGLTGWRKDGFLPVLYSEWDGGPLIGKLGDYGLTCDQNQVSMQFWRHYDAHHEGPYYPAPGTADAVVPISQADKDASDSHQAVCVVWAPEFGNDAPGSAAKLVSYTWTNLMPDGVNAVAADFGNLLCRFRVAESLGMPVVWHAQPSLDAPVTVPADYAGLWHTMADRCSWQLTAADGSAPASWTPANGRYIAVLLKAGDRFASTCTLYKRDLEHFLFIPDGLFPLFNTLGPGPRKPSTPSTCRYLITDGSALRNPPPLTALQPYAGQTVSADNTVGPDGIGRFLYSTGCGLWALLDAPGDLPSVPPTPTS